MQAHCLIYEPDKLCRMWELYSPMQAHANCPARKTVYCNTYLYVNLFLNLYSKVLKHDKSY